MRRLGICQKCGEIKIVSDHHIKGYQGKNKDTVAPYCQSCDVKAHKKARREGRCQLTVKETTKLSSSSSIRRSQKQKHFYTTVAPNIELRERIVINMNNGNIYVYSAFKPHNGHPLKTINET